MGFTDAENARKTYRSVATYLRGHHNSAMGMLKSTKMQVGKHDNELKVNFTAWELFASENPVSCLEISTI